MPCYTVSLSVSGEDGLSSTMVPGLQATTGRPPAKQAYSHKMEMEMFRTRASTVYRRQGHCGRRGFGFSDYSVF